MRGSHHLRSRTGYTSDPAHREHPLAVSLLFQLADAENRQRTRACLYFAQIRDERPSLRAVLQCRLADLDEVQRGEGPRPGAHRAVASPAAKNIHTQNFSSLSGSQTTFEPDYGGLSDALEPCLGPLLARFFFVFLITAPFDTSIPPIQFKTSSTDCPPPPPPLLLLPSPTPPLVPPLTSPQAASGVARLGAD